MNEHPAASPYLRPDYEGGSIVNLVASVVAGLGGQACHAPCPALPVEEVGRFRNVVLLLIDGLGWEFLQQQDDNLISDAVRTRLTSVFPSTTATAITSYMTGLTPSEHGLTGWFTYLRELGSVATVLPFRPRHGGPSYSAMGIPPERVFHWPNVFERMQASSSVVTPHYIVDSDYSRATAGPAQRLPYRDLDGYFHAIEQALRTPADRRYVYAYWPELDSLCHVHGTTSKQVRQHFEALCTGLEKLLAGYRDGETLLLLCADHGHIDTAPASTLDVESHPHLVQCLSLPLCGEPRAAFCYVHADRAETFERYVAEELADQCRLVPRAELLDSGLLGGGSAHAELHHRVGDYLLLMQDNRVIRDRLPGQEKLVQVGVHGGLSAQELFVPLARFET